MTSLLDKHVTCGYFSTLFEQRTCVNIDHVSVFHQLSVNVIQVREVAHFCLALLMKSSLVVAYPQLFFYN